MEIKNILITNYVLNTYEGSQLLTFDIANYFHKIGVHVTVIGFIVDEPIVSLFQDNGIEIIDPIKHPKEIFRKTYDIVWGHHWPILGFALFEMEISCKYLILGSLSPFVSIETIWMLTDEANIIFFNSIENMNVHKQSFKKLEITNKFHVMLNSLPNEWLKDSSKIPKTTQLKSIAIISNHIPSELIEAVTHLKKKNIKVKLIGSEYSLELVTPELIDKYDAIVTIGHTVQKALARGKSVYCYDRFGGPGWITQENIDKSCDFNFSGRCCNRKLSSLEISNEIIDEFSLVFKTDFTEKVLSQFSLEKNISTIIHKLKHTTTYKSFADKNIEKKICQAYTNSNAEIKLYIPAESNIETLSKEILTLTATNTDKDDRIKFFHLDKIYHEFIVYNKDIDSYNITGLALTNNKDLAIVEMYIKYNELVILANIGLHSPGLGNMYPNIAYSDFSRFSINTPKVSHIKDKPFSLFARLKNSDVIKLVDIKIS